MYSRDSHLGSLILDFLAAGESAEKIREEYPQLTRDDILAAIAHGVETVAPDKVERDRRRNCCVSWQDSLGGGLNQMSKVGHAGVSNAQGLVSS